MIDDLSGCTEVSDVRFRPIMSQSKEMLRAQRESQIDTFITSCYNAILWLRGFQTSGWCLHSLHRNQVMYRV